MRQLDQNGPEVSSCGKKQQRESSRPAGRRRAWLMLLLVIVAVPSAHALGVVAVDDSGSFMSTIGCAVLRWCTNLLIPVGGLGIVAAALLWAKGTQMNEMIHGLVTVVLVVTVGMSSVGILNYIGMKIGAGISTTCMI